jgi:hypothetical protein
MAALRTLLPLLRHELSTHLRMKWRPREHLPRKHEAPSSNPRTAKEKRMETLKILEAVIWLKKKKKKTHDSLSGNSAGHSCKDFTWICS